ncbi:MAG: nodulation protein NfeD [Chloroflexota bacterium]
MLKTFRMLLWLSLTFVALTTIEAQGANSHVDVLRVKGTVNPVLADYISCGIEHAESTNAVACIIQLDTPGGLDTSMRDIIKDIVDARVPVVVFVSPSGARAASAGVFITVAAHVAAMAPNTAIGAAHPVSIGAGGETQISETMEEKVVNDAAAYIRSIAGAHGRNVDWAEKAVRESVSATEREALELNVIDIVATDLNDLLAKLDGRQVNLLGGRTVTIETKGAAINYVDMSIGEDFLNVIGDPTIAYLLLGIAMLGIMVEIYSPGLIFLGVIGGICLFLGLYSLGVLPVNWAGVLLIVLAFGLFIAELFTPGFGLLASGGIISLILGSLILFKGGPLFRVNPWLVAVTVIIIAGFLFFVGNRVIQAHRRQATTGREELVGKTATVKAALQPEGMVLFKGELWDAVSNTGNVEPGEEVIINKVEGLKLYVTKKQ